VYETPARVGVAALVKELSELGAVAVKRARNVDLIAPDDDDSLPHKQLLSDVRGQSSLQVSLSVDDDLLFEHLTIIYP